MGNTIGGNEFLAKPVKTDELIELLKEF